ncbi:hypothetical protein PG995_004525, partial [Apiospora arundinis]
HLDHPPTETFVEANKYWDKISKFLICFVDAALNWYFLRIVKQRLVKYYGLNKYAPLVSFNAKLMVLSVGMDVLLIGLMFLPNQVVFIQFHPVTYIVKLNIEMAMANMIRKLARTMNNEPESGSGGTHRFQAVLINEGTNHVVRVLQFEDPEETYWVARIPKGEGPYKGQALGSRLQAEVAVLNLILERTKVRVPRVFDYESTANNPVGGAFILMEFLPGNVAMDAFDGWMSHQSIIPPPYRDGFYSSVAKIQVKTTYVK